MAHINYRLIFLSIFILFFVSFSYADYPQFEYSSQNFPAGQVDIQGQASSGTQLELFVNGLTVGTKDIVNNVTEVILDGSSIENQVLAYGSTIIFKNEGARIYQLNISGVYKELNYGDQMTYVADEIGDILYFDNFEGISKTISVVDTLTDFNFEYINDYLEDGTNNLRFVQKYPFNDYTNQSSFNYTINFDKYPNEITVTNYTNITNQKSGFVQGYVQSVSYPAYYLVNIDPKNLGNVGALNYINLTGDRFNISLSDLKERNNSIYIITTDPNNQNVFTGLRKVTIVVDTIAPELNIVQTLFEKSGSTYSINLGTNVYINGNDLKLVIETDAAFINYTFNNETYEADEIINGSVNISLNLDDGLNPLVLEAYDLAGNLFKESHNIYFDDELPDIVDDSLKPEEMFDSGVVHFFFQQIEGKTNKPDVKLTIFTIPKGSEASDGDRVTCDKYEELFLRNLGQLDREKVDGPELNMNESQVSLTNLMFQKTTVNSDGDGKFKALIGLQEKDITRKEYNDASSDKEKSRSDKIDTVDSDNLICFAMSDKYGNVKIHSESVTLDAGNTMWKVGEITTIPNTIYAAEIENSGDERDDGDNVEFSVIARFHYIGGGEINSLNSFRISEDTKVSKHSKYVSIDSSRTEYSLDTDTGDLTVYFVVEISPMDIDPLDYPDSFELGFKAKPVYTVDDYDIPIDTDNPIYFQTSVNVESPLDSAKWLTPSMIDDTLKFLNKSIEFTETAIEWTGMASVGGVLACTGMKFWYGWEVAAAGDDKDKINDAKKKMFQVCDRVMCSSSPDECNNGDLSFDKGESGVYTTDITDKDQTATVDKDGKLTGKIRLDSNDLLSNGRVYGTDENDNEVLAQFDNLVCTQTCDYNSGAGDTNKSDGLICNGKATNYNYNDGNWKQATEKSSVLFRDECVPYKTDENGNIEALNLQGASNVCFKEGPDAFDETRCPTLGYGEPLKGWDPSDNIIESVACGCITDTYSHLKNYLKIQEAIRGCLEQAKIGETQGSYCERLMGQAVCDVATNVLFKTAGQLADGTGTDGKNPHESGLFSTLDGVAEGDKILNKRYEGTFYSKAGLNTDQIVNKVCLGAVTGDWSALTDNILSAVDQNEVEPVFGPLLAESRLQGYDPFTGIMSIRYTFTYAAVSGGQRIDSDVEFICDSSQPGGDYCPTGRYSSDQLDAEFNMPSLYISDGSSKQDTVIITDTNAKFRYNIIKVTHKYQLDKETKTKEITENIFQKGEYMLANCYFTSGVYGSGAGIKCNRLFDNDALASAYSIDKDKTYLIPQVKKTYYPGEVLYSRIGYKIIQDEFTSQTEFDLAYKIECPSSTSSEKATFLDYKTIKLDSGTESGSLVVNLTKIPNVGSSTSDVDVTKTYQVKGEFKVGEQHVIKFTNKKTDEKVGLDILNSGDIDFKFRNCSGNYLLNAKEELVCEIEIKYDTSNLEFKFKGDLSNINLNFVGGKTFTEVTTTDSNSFETIGPGSCKLTLKVLAPGKGLDAKASVSAFDNISNVGDNIITSDNLDVSKGYTLDFDVAKELTDATDRIKVNSIEFYNPAPSGSFCIDEESRNSNSLDLNFILQSLQPNILTELNYSWALQKYAYQGSGVISSSDLKVGINKGTLDLGKAFDTLLKDGTSQEVTFSYELKGEEDKVTYPSGQFKFNIQALNGSGCSDWSFYDYEYNKEDSDKNIGDEHQ